MSQEQKIAELTALLQERDRELATLREVVDGQKKGFSFLAALASLFTLGPSLSQTVRRWASKYLKLGQLPKHETVELLVAVVRRMAWVGLIGLLIAAIPVILLYQQNQLIRIQTVRIENQNQLIEAQRRSSLVFELTSILDEIDEEIDELNYETTAFNAERDGVDIENFTPEEKERFQRRAIRRSERPQFQLSQRLTGRVVALSRSLRPYRYLDNSGEIVDRPLSPERGQLLVSLVDSGISMEDINHELRMEFSDADLSGASFVDADLTHIGLPRASLTKSILTSVVLNYANLTDADLSHSNLKYAKLNSTTLAGTNLFGADLQGACIQSATLTNVDLRCSNLCGIRWHRATFENVNVEGATGLTETLRTAMKAEKIDSPPVNCPTNFPACDYDPNITPPEPCWD